MPQVALIGEPLVVLLHLEIIFYSRKKTEVRYGILLIGETEERGIDGERRSGCIMVGVTSKYVN